MNIVRKPFIVIFISLFFSTLSAQTLYKNNVIASYYGEAFHGKKTSNGETFNMNAYTCAHKTLPFNTVLKVTNLANGKSIQVRVNDRGPFVKGREIDLSKATAISLGMIKTGTTKVKLEIVKLGAKTKLSNQTAASAVKIMAKKGETISTWIPDTSKAPEKKYTAGITYDIQLGAFSSRENANKQAQKLLKAGFKNVVFQKYENLIRVAIRNIDGADIPELEKKLQEKGFTEYTIKQRKK